MLSFTFLEKLPNKIFPHLQSKNYALYIIWRELCHLTGSLFLILISYFLKPLIPAASIIIFVVLLLWMTYQEFYLHPKKYDQKLWKGILDWLSWIAPFVIYLTF